MQWPSITAGYLAVLALIYAGLGLRVIWLRSGNQAPSGDGGNRELHNAIRAHANFAEYVPISVLTIALLEMSGLSALRVHLLMGALLFSRLLHPFGLDARPTSAHFYIFRTGGITLTFLVLIASAVMMLSRLWPSL